MVTQHTQANDDSAATTHIETGEFPFRLTEGSKESPYVTWLRNHSNYMAARGLFDYLRAGAVLVRGIINNFLIFLPYLLIVAMVLAFFHHSMRAHPFILTLGVLGVAVVWILSYPVTIPLFKIAAYKRSVETGSESSVKQRDLYERTFGFLLFVIIAGAALESLPWALEFFHDLSQQGKLTWQSGLATASAGLALLSGSNALLSALSGFKKQVAMVLIGILGLLVPLIVILSATEFLLYGEPPEGFWVFSPLAVPVVGVGAILVALIVGLRGRAFTNKEKRAVVGLLIGSLVLIPAVLFLSSIAVFYIEKSLIELDGKLQKIREVASQFESVANKQEMTPEVAELVGQFVNANRNFKSESLKYEKFVNELKEQDLNKNWLQKLKDAHNYNQALIKYSSSQLPFTSLGDKLSTYSDEHLEPLRREITRLANGQLIERLNKGSKSDDRVAEQLRSTLVEHYFSPLPGGVSQNDSGREDDLERIVRERFKSCVANLCDQNKAIVQARADLEKLAVPDIAILISEEQLARAVANKFKEVPGKAEAARLVGKEELAKHLTRQELLDLVFSVEERTGKEFVTRTHRKWYLENALPAFPGIGTQDAREGNLRTALDLALLGSMRPAVPPDVLRSQKLALFHSTGENVAPAFEGDPVIEEIAMAAGEVLARRVLKDFDVDHLRALAFGLRRELPVVAEGAPNGTKLTEVPANPGSGGKYVFSLTDDAEGLFAIDASSGVVRVVDGTRLNDEVSPIHTITWQATDQRGSVTHQDLEIQVADKDKLQKFLDLAKSPLKDLILKAFSSDLPSTELSRQEQDQVVIWNQPPYLLDDGYLNRILLAARALGNDTDALARLARMTLIEKLLSTDNSTIAKERGNILQGFATHDPKLLGRDELARIAVAKFWAKDTATTDDLITKIMFGEHGRLEQRGLAEVEKEFTNALKWPKVIFISLLAILIWLGCWLTVDVNLTSVHGLYRDRLASAFLIGKDTKGDIDIEEDIDLDDICCYEARSTAPYHLINVALNLQGSKDPVIRDRKSDFFIFSKRFIGGDRTGYCRSETMEQVFPQMDVATAMAISAAAASPNMGRGTSPLLVAFMTLLNIRLGYWVPNPGLLEEFEEKENRLLKKRRRKDSRRAKQQRGFTFKDVFAEELREIERRWGQVYPDGSRRRVVNPGENTEPTVEHGLVGIGYSGGGIRSATFNLGLTQALHHYGVFDHLDYMSTVSGGGYLGSSISTLMRSREKLASEIDGMVAIEKTRDEQIVTVRSPEKQRSNIAGIVTIEKTETDERSVKVQGLQPDEHYEYPFSKWDKVLVQTGETVNEGQELIQIERTYRFSSDARLIVRDGQSIKAGVPLLKPRAWGRSYFDGKVADIEVASTGESIVKVQGKQPGEYHEYLFSKDDKIAVKKGDRVKAGQYLIQRYHYDTLGERFRWRIRPWAFLREMFSMLNETHRWVNLSDGGHIENLAAIELLRRRCKYIIIGDGEADPNLHFGGLAALMRCASIDLGIRIDIDLDAIRLGKSSEDNDAGAVSGAHWAIGTITYPKNERTGEPEIGYLLYLKSSFTGDESEVIREYRHRNPTFPHQTTADQFFDEDQFEAYRALGQHIAEELFKASNDTVPHMSLSFGDFEEWFTRLREKNQEESESPATKSST